MATRQETPTIKLSANSQKSILQFAKKVLEYHVSNNTEIREKMDIIDRAYARYKELVAQGTTDGGVDIRAGDVTCDVFDTKDKVTPPIVVSQVDAYVAYLADVFLSGTPLFPVVSTPAYKQYAEQLETLMDDHAQLGGYVREFLMFLRDGVKYNFCGIEVEWDALEQYSSLADYMTGTGSALQKNDKFYNKVKRLDPRNIVRDPTVLPGELSKEGDYAGYIERLSMTKMKRKLIKLQKQGRAFNIKSAMDSGQIAAVTDGTFAYAAEPQISNYVTNNGYHTKFGVDWDAWAEGKVAGRKNPSYGAMYEVLHLYARIIPSDHGIISPQPNTPQIWKIIVVNNQHVVACYRVISAYDYLPILIGQPLEDGFGQQTQSVAEGEIPFQEAAETLFNIRFASARRAVSDRALYNSNYIKPAHVNSKSAAPKIPVNISALNPISLDQIYRQIPFDMRGTESTIQDAQTIVQFSKELHGLNGPRMGQFQKGNKSVTEWNDTMGGSDARLRLPALTLEYQVFAPFKSIAVLNIFQYGDDAELVSQKTGEIVKINIAELRKRVLSFRLADGYNPKAKLASMDMIVQGMQMIQQSPVLQQAYGSNLPAMFAHMMQLAGVRGLEEYDPKYQVPAAGTQAGPDPLAALMSASLQPTATQQLDPTQTQMSPQGNPELP